MDFESLVGRINLVQNVLQAQAAHAINLALTTRNWLVIHIVNEYFFYIPLTLENVDRRLGLVPYCLHRPDLAHEEIPDIKKVSDWGLARRWAALTAPPAPPVPAEG